MPRLAPRPCPVVAAALSAFAMCAAHAEGTPPFKDWDIACDNTRHCEAVGFATEADAGPDTSLALWLARDAGPDTPVVARLTVPSEHLADKAALCLTVGRSAPIELRNAEDIDPAVLAHLLPLLLDADSAGVAAGKDRLTLSLQGLKAALLKMDELQGRLGTPGALVRKGSRAESTVLPALPAPRVSAVAPVANRPGDARLLDVLLKKIDPGCSDDEAEGNVAAPSRGDTSLHRVSATQVIVVRQCQGGYNAVSDLWLANDKPPYAIAAVEMSDGPTYPPTGDGVGLANARFAGATLETAFEDRGVGDCASLARWSWTGRQFILTQTSEQHLCRGVSAGDVNLRTWTTRP